MADELWFHIHASQAPTPDVECPVAVDEAVIVEGATEQPWTVRYVYPDTQRRGLVCVEHRFPGGPQSGHVGISGDVPTARVSPA